MANADKIITIRPRTGSTTNNPVIEFVGADGSTAGQTITAEITPVSQGTLTFAGTSGTILALADNATYKLDVNGDARINGDLTVTGSTTISGSTTFDTDIVPDTDNTGNVGTEALTWANGRFTDFTVDGTLTTTNLNIGTDSIAEYIADTVGAMVTSNTESGITVTYQDADNTLDFDVGDFSITLTGDVTGSGTVTNLGNVSFATTIAANSVALGTDTTGNYMVNVQGTANEIQVTHTQSEGSTATIGLPDSVTITSNLTVGADLVPDTDNTGNVGTAALTWNNGQFTNLTIDSTLSVRGAIDLADNDVLRIGSSDDFQLLHNGTQHIIQGNNASNLILRNSTDTENYIVAAPNDAVTLYFNGSSRLSTSSAGVTVTGDLSVTGGDLTTTATTFNLVNTTASTLNIGGAATAVAIGAATGTTTVNNSLTVSGNLTVSGTTTTINSETITIADNILLLNANVTGTPTENAGIAVERGTALNTGIQWNEGANYWELTNDGNNLYKILTTADEGTGNGLDADTLDGQEGTYYLDWTNVTNKPDPVVTVTLTGDVTGTANATLTDLGNGTISVATTIAANSVALGTDTTGNYMVNVQGTTNEIEVTHTQGEGSTATIGLPNNVTVTGDLTVGADLVPDTDNTGNVGTAALTWNYGHFTGLEIDSTLRVRGIIDLADDDILRFGTSNDWEFYHNGSANFIDLNVGDLIIRDNTTIRFRFHRTTGNLTLQTGDLAVNGGDITTTATTFNLVDTTATTLNIGGAATSLNLGATTGTTTVRNNLAVNGNTTLGDATTDTITFTARQASDLVPSTNNTRNLGSASLAYNTVYATLFNGTALKAYYADLAENYEADSAYEPGTVLVFGGEKELTTTATSNNFRVAGVVSTEPATLMNSQLEGDTVVPLALQGRVPCKVIGRVEKGDMIVTSSVPGYGMVNNQPAMGTVIGKAVGTKTDTERGMVEVVVGRV